MTGTAQPGRLPAVPEGTRVWAVGDIHGRLDLLEAMLELIAADAAASSARRRVVVFLGDYVDRGPDSAGVISRLAKGPPPGFDWIMLRGNHEDMMLRFLVDTSIGALWLRNGGWQTMDSYSGNPVPEAAAHVLSAWLAHWLPVEHLSFLDNTRFLHVEGDYAFVHAGLRPGIPVDEQTPEDLMWIRGPFLASTSDHGKVVVHGHTITPAPEDHGNRIGIDTGAFHSGRLTAFVAEGTWRGFLST